MKKHVIATSIAVSIAASLLFAGCGGNSGGGGSVANAPTVDTANPAKITTIAEGTTAAVGATATAQDAQGVASATNFGSMLGGGVGKIMKTVGKSVASTSSPADYFSSMCKSGSAKFSGDTKSATVTFTDCKAYYDPTYGYEIINGTWQFSGDGKIFNWSVDESTKNFDAKDKLESSRTAKYSLSNASYDAATGSYSATLSGTSAWEDLYRTPNAKYESTVDNLKTTYSSTSNKYTISSGSYGGKKAELDATTKAYVQKYYRAMSFKDFAYSWGTTSYEASIDGAFAINNAPDTCKRNGTYILKTLVPTNFKNKGKIQINDTTTIEWAADGKVTVTVGSTSKGYASYSELYKEARTTCSDFEESVN